MLPAANEGPIAHRRVATDFKKAVINYSTAKMLKNTYNLRCIGGSSAQTTVPETTVWPVPIAVLCDRTHLFLLV